jgi:hypothetical protein
LNRGV